MREFCKLSSLLKVSMLYFALLLILSCRKELSSDFQLSKPLDNKIASSTQSNSSQTIPAEADAYVNDGNLANNNYGGLTYLVAKDDTKNYKREIFMKFNLSTLLANQIESAQVDLVGGVVNTGESNAKWQYYITDANWNESTITWNNTPTIGNMIGEVAGRLKYEGSVVSFNIPKEILTEVFNSSSKILSIKIVAKKINVSGSSFYSDFVSKESQNIDYRPKLIVNYRSENFQIPYSRNIVFNNDGFNQFLSDLQDVSSKSRVTDLYENQANAALQHVPTPFSSLYPSEELKAAASSAATTESGYVKALAFKILATTSVQERQPYLDKAASILKAWAKVNVTSWHRPNETALFGMYEGYSIIRSSLPITDRDTIDNWIRNRAKVQSNNFTVKSSAPNNVNNWEAQRLAFLIYSGYILEDQQLISRAKTEYSGFLNTYLLVDGKTYDYTHRGAFAYHSYGLWSIAHFLQAIYAFEGGEVFTNILNQKNTKGLALVDAIKFWEPYLCGLYHDEFKTSSFSSERNGSRRGRYNPAGDMYVMDKLVGFFPNRLSTYMLMLKTDKNRFSNLATYISTLGNISVFETVNGAQAEFYKHCSYGVRLGGLGVGGYTLEKLIANGIPNNDLSSLKVPNTLQVLLFDGDFKDEATAGGQIKVIVSDTNCLTNIFNDMASSVIVIYN